MKSLILFLTLILTLSGSAQQLSNPTNQYVGHWIAESDSDTKNELIIYKESEDKVTLVEIMVDHEGGMNRGVLLATVYSNLNTKGEIEVEVVNPSTLAISQYVLTFLEGGKLLKKEGKEANKFIKY